MAFAKSFLKPPLTFPAVSGDVCSFVDKLGGFPLKAHEVSLVAKQAAGTPSPSSPLPISGWDAIHIGNANDFNTNIEQGTLDNNGLNANADNRIRTQNYIPVVSGHTYKFTIIGNGAYYLGVSGYSDDDYSTARTQSTAWLGNNSDLLIDSGVKFVRINVRFQTNTAIVPSDISGILITDVSNYNTIQIGSTIYGGTYDAITGILTVTHGFITLNGTQALRTTNWNPKTNSVGWIYQWSVTQNAIESATVTPDIITDNPDIIAIPYNTIQNQDVEGIGVYTSSGWFGLILRIADTSLTDATAINNYMAQHPLKVVYQLETPETIQLSPAQILTLKNNNIWADTGATSLRYIKIGR